ncbi:MAG: hypothetical protein ACR2N5_01510, partial [Solirubrobacterales bacterium]
MGGAGGTIALGVAFLLGAAGFGSPALFVPGVALLLLGAGAVAWVELASRTARLARREGPSRITEGDPYPLAIRMVGGLARVPGGVLE